MTRRIKPAAPPPPLADQVNFLFGLLLRTFGLFALIRPMIANGGLIARYNEPRKRTGFNEVRDVLYWAFILELIKLCGDSDSRTPSISKVIDAIKQPNVRSALEADHTAQRSLPSFPGKQSDMFAMLIEGERAARKERFRRTYAETIVAADRLFGHPALAGYRTVRNKRIAHNELILSSTGKHDYLDLSGLKLKYEDEAEVLDLARAAMDGLSAVVRQSSFEWESFLQSEQQVAEAFWEIGSK